MVKSLTISSVVIQMDTVNVYNLKLGTWSKCLGNILLKLS